MFGGVGGNGTTRKPTIACLFGLLLLGLQGCMENVERINGLVNIASDQYHPRHYTEDLTERVRSGDFDSVAGRREELLLLRGALRGKSNVILVGPAGVGKTTLFHALAQQIVTGKAGRELNNRIVVLIKVVELKERFRNAKGQFYPESYLQLVESAIKWSRETFGQETLVVLDEVQTLVSEFAGRWAEIRNFDNAFKALLEHYSGLAFATTTDEYARYFGDAAVNRRLHMIYVAEPSHQELFSIVNASRADLKKQFGVRVNRGVVDQAIRLSVMNMFDVAAPAAPVGLLRAAAAAASSVSRTHVTKRDVIAAAGEELGLASWRLIQQASVETLNKTLARKNRLHLKLVDRELSPPFYDAELQQLRDAVREEHDLETLTPDVRERRKERCHLTDKNQVIWHKFCAKKKRGKDKKACEQAFDTAKDIIPCSWDANAKVCALNTQAKAWNDPCNLLPPDNCDQNETRQLCVLEPALAGEMQSLQ